MAIGQFQQDIHLWGANQGPKDSKESPLYAPGTQVLIKVWKDGSPKAQLQPKWKGSYPVILSSPTAVKLPRHDSWIAHKSSHGRKQKRTLNISVSPWEISDTYSEWQISAILMNTPKIKFMGIRFLRTALKSNTAWQGLYFKTDRGWISWSLNKEGVEPCWMRHVVSG